MKTKKRAQLIRRRRFRIRSKLLGTGGRPRMSVRFTERNVHVQFIDDRAGQTLASVYSVKRSAPDSDRPLAANVESAKILGKMAAEAALEKGIETVVFDRSGARYHGKVKALAEAARANGLRF